VLADDCVLFDDCCTGVSWSWGLDRWIGEFNWWIGESKLVESSIIFNEVNKVISSSIWKKQRNYVKVTIFSKGHKILENIFLLLLTLLSKRQKYHMRFGHFSKK
jgi:hypothetical protein